MARFRVSLLAALRLLSAALLAALPGPGDAQTVNHLVISEVLYDPVGTEPDGEWIEIFNPTGSSVALSGWKLNDNSSSQDIIPNLTLSPGQFLVVAAKESAFRSLYPAFSGNLVSLENAIGNGLSNTGDRVILFDDRGNPADAVSYGSDTFAFAPACPRVSEGQSLARVPSAQDTNTATDWVAQAAPSPGEAGVPPTSTPSATNTATSSTSATASATGTPTATPSVSPTASPTRTPTSTASATATATTGLPTAQPKLLLSEVFYDAPQAGTDSDYEWVEILNPTTTAVDLAGWKLRDNTTEDAIPHFVLAPGEYLIVAATAGEVRSRYDVSCERAAQREQGLRLKLRIQAPELAVLPWEFLYDPRQAEYICLSRNTPLVRDA